MTLDDLESYVLRLGKKCPTQADAMEFAFLSEGVNELRKNCGLPDFWIPVRRAMLNEDGQREEVLREYFKFPVDAMEAAKKAAEDCKNDSRRFEDFMQTAKSAIARQRPDFQNMLSAIRPNNTGRANQLPPDCMMMKPIHMARKACRHCDSEKCSDDKEKLLACSRCRSVWYCSKEHQKADWKRHKVECKPHPVDLNDVSNFKIPALHTKKG